MWQLAVHAAQAQIDVGFAEIDGFELRVAVGHVQKRHLAESWEYRTSPRMQLPVSNCAHALSPMPAMVPAPSTCINSRLVKFIAKTCELKNEMARAGRAIEERSRLLIDRRVR
jgi:hypothetical protein